MCHAFFYWDAVMNRLPEDLPNEHVLLYPPEDRVSFIPATDPKFSKSKSSAELPAKSVLPKEDES